ncbi:MAG: hypothetical protein R3F62_26910 [Planctomycetota bacterium]
MHPRSLAALSLVVAVAPALAQSARDTAEARKEIRRYASGDKQEIAAALKALLAMGEKAVPALVQALSDRNELVAKYSGGTLSRIGAPAIERLVPLLGSSNDQARREAYGALVRMGEVALPARRPRGKNPRVKEAGLAILKQLGKEPPAGTAPAPPQGGEGVPQPPQPRATKVPTIRGEGPAERPFRRELRRVDDDREALSETLLGEIADRVADGELAQARALLWGLWAQAKRERLWATRHLGQRRTQLRDRLVEIDTRYQRARDLCYGSSLPFGPTDGAETVAEHLRLAEVAAEGGDLSTLRAALSHANGRVAGGVVLDDALKARQQALLAAYEERNQTASKTLIAQVSALSGATQVRDGLTVEGQLHELAAGLERVRGLRVEAIPSDRRGLETLQSTAEWALGVKQDLKALAGKLEAFAAACPDPDYADNLLEAMVEADPTNYDAFDSFTAAVRLAVYGERLWQRWDVDGALYGAYLGACDAALARAERHAQCDQQARCDVELELAASLRENAKTVGAPEDELARRVQRGEEIAAQRGVGKLERTLGVLDKAAHAFSEAVRTGSDQRWRDGCERLAAAREGLAQAHTAGLSDADRARASARLNEVAALEREAGAAAVRADLAKVQGFLEDAQGFLRSGGDAWRARKPLGWATPRLEQVEALAQEVGPELVAEAQALRARLGEVTTQVLEAQRLPVDAYEAGDGGRWRRDFRSSVVRARLGGARLSIVSEAWKERTRFGERRRRAPDRGDPLASRGLRPGRDPARPGRDQGRAAPARLPPAQIHRRQLPRPEAVLRRRPRRHAAREPAQVAAAQDGRPRAGRSPRSSPSLGNLSNPAQPTQG